MTAYRNKSTKTIQLKSNDAPTDPRGISLIFLLLKYAGLPVSVGRKGGDERKGTMLGLASEQTMLGGELSAHDGC